MKEKNLDNDVLTFLKNKGCWCIKYWAGAKYTKTGVPDILACVDGIFFGIEDKAKTGKPSLLQLINLEWIRHAGGIGILLYPDDFENFKRLVEETLTGKEYSKWANDWYTNNIALQNEWKKKLEII